MNNPNSAAEKFGEVREDFVPASDYFSPEFARLENELLWPRVWQMACREEDIPAVGDFYTYEIVDDSIIVIRTAPEEIRAYHNACPHRGRRLTNDCGRVSRFHCRFHGWQFSLDGSPLRVVDREDWGEKLKDEDISLVPVKVGCWGGWVYINMDPDCESLESFLDPVIRVHAPLNMEGMRYHWRKTAIVPCNWKTVLGLFNEAYHLQETHRQMLPFWDDYTTGYRHGRHAMYRYENTRPVGLPSIRLGSADGVDMRKGLAAFVEEMNTTLETSESVLMRDAAKRLLEEVAEDAEPMEVLMKLAEFTNEDLVAKGIEPPLVTPEQLQEIGADWQIFPNHILISSPNSCLSYRARPNGHDPDTAVWDVISLLRFPPGEEPGAKQEWCNDLTDPQAWPKILRQDFENMADIQKGMKSRGFRGARTNPSQEIAVWNLQRTLREFMGI